MATKIRDTPQATSTFVMKDETIARVQSVDSQPSQTSSDRSNAVEIHPDPEMAQRYLSIKDDHQQIEQACYNGCTRSMYSCCPRSNRLAVDSEGAVVVSKAMLQAHQALSGNSMSKPCSREEADSNIGSLEQVRRQLQQSRLGATLGRQEKRTLRQEMKNIDDEEVIRLLKEEKMRLKGSD